MSSRSYLPCCLCYGLHRQVVLNFITCRKNAISFVGMVLVFTITARIHNVPAELVPSNTLLVLLVMVCFEWCVYVFVYSFVHYVSALVSAFWAGLRFATNDVSGYICNTTLFSVC